MDSFLAFCNQTQGRDKLCRVTQYGSKFLGWYISQHSKDENIVNLLKELEKTMSTSRKLFRMGRSIESLRAAQRAANLQNFVLRWTLSASHLNKAMFLLVDHYIWFGRTGLVKADLQKWGKRSAEFYLAALVFAFLRDLYALYIDMERCRQNAKFESQDENRKPYSLMQAVLLWKVMKKNPQATVDAVKNACDIVIPMSSLGYLKVNNGVVGVCGLISSILGAYQIANPAMKLKP